MQVVSRKSKLVGITLLLAGISSLLTVALMAQSATNETASSTATAAYGGCSAPAQAGVHVCFPTGPSGFFAASPMQVIATGTGGGGPVKLMEVFVDGKKVAQASGNLFDAPITFATGQHTLTVVELDTTGSYKKSTRQTLVVDNSTANEVCTPPGAPGVNVCIPQPGSCHTAAYSTFVAAGTGASGTVSRMELWVNGTKLANFPGNRINTNFSFLPDFDKVTIIEVDSKGAYIKATPIILQSC